MSKIPYSYPTLAAQITLYGLAQEVVKMFQRVAKVVNEPDFGVTADRPTLDLVPAQQYFDTTLNQPIWWDATAVTWRDASGTPV